MAVTSLMKSSSSLSVLNMAGCEIQNHGAQVMCRALMGSTVQLLNIDMSSCGLSREPALEVCQQLTSIHGLSTLNLSNNQLNEQTTDVLALALRQEGCRLKSVSLNNCCIGQSGVLHLLGSLQGNSVLWELHVAGNVSLGSTKPQPVAVIPEIVPQIDMDICNHAVQQILQSSNSAAKQGCNQSDSTDLENHKNDAALKVIEPAQGNAEHFISGCPSDQNAQDLEGQPIDLTVSDKSFGNVDLLNEDTQLNEDFLGTNETVNKAKLAEVVEAVEVVEVVEAVGVVEDPEAVIRVADPVIEELAVRIRMARGIQCLNMTDNGLSGGDLKQLWEAWCDGGRTAKKEYMGKAHFVVQDGRDCSALFTSCVSCQPRT